VNDLEERLANQQRIVEALNDQLKAAASGDGKEPMTSVIRRMREQMAAEFERYRLDSALFTSFYDTRVM